MQLLWEFTFERAGLPFILMNVAKLPSSRYLKKLLVYIQPTKAF